METDTAEATKTDGVDVDRLDDMMEVDGNWYQVPLRLKVKGQVKDYALVELSGAERSAYMKNMSGRAVFDDNGNATGLSTFDGIIELLIMKSMHTATIEQHDGRSVVTKVGSKVSREAIDSLSSRVQGKIADRIKAISGLDDDAKAKAKKK